MGKDLKRGKSYGNWRKQNPCYVLAKKLATLSPVGTWKVEDVPNEVVIKVRRFPDRACTCCLLAAHTKMQEMTQHVIIKSFVRTSQRDFPGGPVVKTLLPLQGARVPALVRELRSRMPRGAAKKKRKQNEPHKYPTLYFRKNHSNNRASERLEETVTHQSQPKLTLRHLGVAFI